MEIIYYKFKLSYKGLTFLKCILKFYSEIHPVAKGVLDTYDIIIVLSRHVESTILLQRENSKTVLTRELNKQFESKRSIIDGLDQSLMGCII